MAINEYPTHEFLLSRRTNRTKVPARMAGQGLRVLAGLTLMAAAPWVSACDGGSKADEDTDATPSDTSGGTGEATSEDIGGALELQDFFACSDRIHTGVLVNDEAIKVSLANSRWRLGGGDLEHLVMGADGSFNITDLRNGVEEIDVQGNWAVGGGQLQLNYDDGYLLAPETIFDRPEHRRRGGTELFSTQQSVAIEGGDRLHLPMCETTVLHRVGEGTGLDGTWVGSLSFFEEYREGGYHERWVEATSTQLVITGGHVEVEYLLCGAGQGNHDEYLEFDRDRDEGTIYGTPQAFELQLGWDTLIPLDPGDPAGEGEGGWVGESTGWVDEWGEYDWGESDWGESGDAHGGIAGRLLDDRTMLVQDILYASRAGAASRSAARGGDEVVSACHRVARRR